MGRQTAGVIGMRLREEDEVLAMALAGQGDELVTISEGGYGKRTTVKEYPRKGRGGNGRGNPQADVSTGRLAGAFVGFRTRTCSSSRPTGS